MLIPDDLIAVTAKGFVSRRTADVEARLLGGANRLTVDDEFAGIVFGRTVYEVPRWRDHPLRRLRVERLRRRYCRAREAVR